MASFFASVAASVLSVTVTVCSAVTFTGNTTHHNQPSSQKIDPNDIAHRGPYFGARHTGSLGQANSTIFFKPNAASARGALALHVVESPMVLTQRIQAAKALAANTPVKTAEFAIAAAMPEAAQVIEKAKAKDTPEALAIEAIEKARLSAKAAQLAPQPAPVLKPAKQGIFEKV